MTTEQFVAAPGGTLKRSLRVVSPGSSQSIAKPRGLDDATRSIVASLSYSSATSPSAATKNAC